MPPAHPLRSAVGPRSLPLHVRLPRREADALDRAAFESKVSKRELVTSMVKRFLVEETPVLVVGRAWRFPRAALLDWLAAR